MYPYVKAGECFGELAALKLDTERALTIKAKSPAIVYSATHPSTHPHPF